MILVGFALLKFLVYYGVCHVAVPMLGLTLQDRASFALKWAAVRLGTGLVLGYPIFMLFALGQRAGFSDGQSYAVSFLVFRYLAWLFVLLFILRSQKARAGKKGQVWVALGVATNLALDWAAIAAGADDIKFFC
jgi:hypothetical protein